MVRQTVFSILAAVLMMLSNPVSVENANAADGVQLAQDNLLQCMTHCIKQEGEDDYDTCKLRCASVPMQPAQQQDCMGDFKQCKKVCKSNKDCKKECKAALMTCS